jgi:methyl-accepting chemotaxis protein
MNKKTEGKAGKVSFAVPLTILIVMVLTISFFIQTLFVTSQVSKKIRTSQVDNLSMITRSISETIKLKIESNEHTLEGYGKALSLALSADQRIQGEGAMEDYSLIFEEIISYIMESNSSSESVFITDRKGNIIADSSAASLGENISGTDYFQNIIIGGDEFFTTPEAYISELSGDIVIVHAVKLYSENEVYGILGIVMDLTIFGEEMVLNKRIGETGYPYILDRNGIILIHPSEALLFTPSQNVDPLFQTVIDNSEEEQILSYTLNGSAKQGVFIRLPELDWMVCLAMDDNEVFSTVRDLRNTLILTSIALVIITGLILLFYVRFKLINKITGVESLISKASEGNLTERGEIKGNDEIAGMSRFFNTLLDSFSGFFIKLRRSLVDLEDVGTELSANMEETAAAVHQIRTNVENSLQQIEKQEESVSSTVTAVEEITQNIQSLDKNIDQQNNSVQQGSSAVEQMIAQIKAVSSSTEEAERLMEVLKGSSSKGKENLDQVSQMVKDIAERSKELEQANALISGIAARTNLLAMNAAIEAAHAGAAGRGFAVVADEIRKLAEQSTSQSTQVKNTITTINKSIQDVVLGSETSHHSFEDILTNMSGLARVTMEIKSSMEEQVAGSTQVLQALEEMRNIGQEVASGSGEMNDGNRVILEAVGQLSQISSEVSLAIREIGHGMDEINQAVLAVADLTIKNKESIDLVRAEASQYRIEED